MLAFFGPKVVVGTVVGVEDVDVVVVTVTGGGAEVEEVVEIEEVVGIGVVVDIEEVVGVIGVVVVDFALVDVYR